MRGCAAGVLVLACVCSSTLSEAQEGDDQQSEDQQSEDQQSEDQQSEDQQTGDQESEALESVPAQDASSPVVVALTLDFPEGCDSQTVVGQVIDRLGRDPFVDDQAADYLLSLSSVESDAPDTLITTHIVIRTQEGVLGRREFEAPACEQLQERAALILTLIIDTQLPEEPPPSSELEEGSQGGSTEEGDPAPVDAVPSATDATELGLPAPKTRLEGEIFGSAMIGYLPGVTGGGGLALSVRFLPWWELRGSLIGWAPSRAEADGRQVEALQLAARVGSCAGPSFESVRLAGCISVEGGALHLSGLGFDENLAAWRGTVRGLLAVRLTVYLDSALFSLGLVAAVPVIRHRAVFENDAGTFVLAHEPGPVSGAAELGVGIAF